MFPLESLGERILKTDKYISGKKSQITRIILKQTTKMKVFFPAVESD